MKNKNSSIKFGFTLAEVLITLTIIGVIAAITIPTLSRKWRDHADVQKVKEAYSILSNAYQLAIKEHGSFAGLSKDQRIEYLLPYLKYEKIAIGYNIKGFEQTYSLSGRVVALNYEKFILLKNGMLFAVQPQYGSSDTFIVDINGPKKPNKVGYDIFWFPTDQNNGIILPQNHHFWRVRKDYCNNIFTKSDTQYAGDTCAYWIMQKGNMDYKYRDVSAEW